MALLPAVADTLDLIPEWARQGYKQTDEGKFVLDADIEAHPQVQGLRNAYKADHEKNKTLQAQLTTLKDVDPDRWNVLKDLKEEDVAELNQLRAEKARQVQNGHQQQVNIEEEFNKRLQPVKTAHQREMEQRDQLLQKAKMEKEQLQGEMKRHRIHTALMTACSLENVIPGAVDDVVLFGERFFKITDEGEVVAHDGSGVEIFGTDGKAMRPREWVSTRGPDKAHWFPLNSGGGAGGGRFGTGGQPVRKADLKDLKAKVEYVKSYGREAYENLPD